MDIKGKISKFIWRIENFSKIEVEKLYSEINIADDDIKWRLLIYPQGSWSRSYLSVYLLATDYKTLPSNCGLAVIDQNDRERSAIHVHGKHSNKLNQVLSISISLLKEFQDPKRGYLINDACVIEAYISTDKSRDLISCKQIVESNSDGHKIKDYVLVNPKKVEIVTLSSTQPSSQNVEIKFEEPNETTEEEMKAFFASIESEFSCSDVIYSREEAREAVAKLEQALSMTPVGFHASTKFSPLDKEFKILASTTTLTIEQKHELLPIEKKLKELAKRAAKAVQDKNLLAEMESNKLTVTRNIERSLIRFKEFESEVKEVEEKLVALQEQVEETQKRKNNILSERKGIFDSCKKMRKQLETLGNELTMFEANVKVAEEEEKTVEAEWKTMKDFITSIKGKI